MYKACSILLLFYFLNVSHIFAIDFDVRIFTGHNLKSVTITPLSGKYVIYSGDKVIASLYKNNSVGISVSNGKISITQQGKELGLYENLNFSADGFLNTFKFKPTDPVMSSRVYDDAILISVEDSLLKIINKVELEHYVAGVVESEGGIKKNLEFLKLQAIISRTYAVSNFRKHLKDDGYNFCDDVHCQVYKGRCINSMIMMAISQTNGDVVIDETNKPISAAFHSNCGGQTINSEDVWSIVTTYLKSVKDTFCHSMSHATWEKEIATKDWLDYLDEKYSYPITDSIMKKQATTYTQTTRKINFCANPLIPLKYIRSDWKLKSTFFSIENKGDSLLIKGRGYGHGVGVCQQGAMCMVDFDWTYKEIIQFYYKHVSIVNISELKNP